MLASLNRDAIRKTRSSNSFARTSCYRASIDIGRRNMPIHLIDREGFLLPSFYRRRQFCSVSDGGVACEISACWLDYFAGGVCDNWALARGSCGAGGGTQVDEENFSIYF